MAEKFIDLMSAYRKARQEHENHMSSIRTVSPGYDMPREGKFDDDWRRKHNRLHEVVEQAESRLLNALGWD